jgi:hypothetical protein
VDDKAFQVKYVSAARLLWEAAKGCPEDIPSEYAEHLSHTYVDGDISLGILLPKVEDYSELDDFEIEEAIELLGKVSPGDWPYIGDIESVSLDRLLEEDKEKQPEFDFVEDNLTTAERVERVLIESISSVFGEKVSDVRSEKGYFPNPKNNFLQEEDGTFAGTFTHDGKKYLFEVFPDEQGWTVTYRMHWDELGKLPPLSDSDNEKKTDYTRQVRHRGWK